jgi:hypothetical protein
LLYKKNIGGDALWVINARIVVMMKAFILIRKLIISRKGFAQRQDVIAKNMWRIKNESWI